MKKYGRKYLSDWLIDFSPFVGLLHWFLDNGDAGYNFDYYVVKRGLLTSW